MSGDEQIDIYIDMLKEGTPFDRFVSHGHQKDPLELDIVNPRKKTERIVNRALRSTISDSTARFVPIVGRAGTGKTHYYWVLKDRETKTEEGKKWKVFYIPSPPAMVRTLQHIYTCLVDEIGLDLIKEVGPGGIFTDREHTALRFRDELWEPGIWSKEMLSGWSAGEKKSDLERARDIYDEIMAREDIPARISPETEKALKKVIERAGREVK